MGTATPPRKTAPATETATSTQGGLIREDSSPEEFMTRAGESLREASPLTNLLTMKAKTRLGTWNITTRYDSGKTAQVASEMRTYNIKVLGLCETRRNGAGQTRLSSGDTIVYSGHEDLDHIHSHSQGAVLLMTTEATRALMKWEPISPRIISARFNSKGRKTIIIQCYAPTTMLLIGLIDCFKSS